MAVSRSNSGKQMTPAMMPGKSKKGKGKPVAPMPFKKGGKVKGC